MKRSLGVLAAAAVLAVSACGSGTKSSSSSADASATTAAAVAGAQENAVGDAVCFDWPSGTTAKACAVGLKGPGGGRVFYDAGSEQPWGRFLEVAPQAWGGTLYDCSNCGAAAGVTKQSSDTYSYPCRSSDRDSGGSFINWVRLLPGEAGDTLWEIGGGRHNTEVLSQEAKCVDGSKSALTLATGYRGGGLSDWYLPSGGELTELCNYTGRNAIGGFEGDPLYSKYASSTVGPGADFTAFYGVDFASKPLCQRKDLTVYDAKQGKDGNYHKYYNEAKVRPIRAFG